MLDTLLTHATGTAERETALGMPGDLPAGARATVGAELAHDTANFVARALGGTPHLTQNISGKRIEAANGWIKTVAGLAQTKHRGLDRVGEMFQLKAAACNLIRLPKLLPTDSSGLEDTESRNPSAAC